MQKKRTKRENRFLHSLFNKFILLKIFYLPKYLASRPANAFPCLASSLAISCTVSWIASRFRALAAKIATEYAREQSDARIVDKIAKIEESGTKILTLDGQTRADIRGASKSVYESIKENIDPAIYNAYMNGIE